MAKGIPRELLSLMHMAEPKLAPSALGGDPGKHLAVANDSLFITPSIAGCLQLQGEQSCLNDICAGGGGGAPELSWHWLSLRGGKTLVE